MGMNVLITGISSGLGMGLANTALKENAKIFAMNRSLPNWHKGSGHLRFESVDLSKFEQIPTSLNLLLEETQKLDLVVLNSGIICEINDMKDTSLDEIDRLMNVNVWANKVILDALFLKKMEIKQVVAISSGASINGNRGWNAYSLSKSTLNMLIKLYAEENKSTHFTSLAPGLIDSPMQEYLCSVPDDKRFSPLQILKKARNTDRMPKPLDAGEIVWSKIKELFQFPSGSYIDVRDL
jgi:NAD(P)-dependent dehydrogenase (short-subunit alcohol dehydrogenase family)